jgi:hypothetical protein
LVSVPGDRDRLRVEIIGKVDGGPHKVNSNISAS